ncbi:MAG TPA: ATP-binding protein [Ktedonobacterales bacterium]|jgi:signal transduction histidine kinase|nr:ATP-binding protein [Ktedonobacterales bacterium]
MAESVSHDMTRHPTLVSAVATDPHVEPVHGATSERLLLADTDIATLKAVAVALRHEGRLIVTASDGATALGLLAQGAFDLVLTDVRVETNGESLLAAASRLAPGAIRIAMTGYATLDSALRALRAGAYNYLIKPLDVEELRLAVAQALERLRLERELAARVAELELAHGDLMHTNERLREQVDAATAELRVKLDELEDKNHLLREAQSQNERFIQMVAHEMRGPLNPIINYAQLAKRPAVSGEARDRYMDTIVEHAMRLNRLIGDLQTATRLSAGQFTLRREPCDVAAVVAELVAESTAAERDRAFMLDQPGGPIIAEVDRDRVGQAVRNLLDNAVKYSAPQGAIETRIWRDEDTVSISVGDYGAGIPEAEMKRIFEPFIRLEEKASEVSGSGLGLFITRGVIGAHGGALTVRNRGEGRAGGAIFTITLPLQAVEAK